VSDLAALVPPLTPEVMAANVAKLARSPYGPGLHVAHGRDERGWYRTACGCRMGREHAVGARGGLAPVIPLRPLA
jgi:hypothetical protein